MKSRARADKRTDSKTLPARRALTRELLAKGVSQGKILKALKLKYGRAIGVGWITAERQMMEAKQKENLHRAWNNGRPWATASEEPADARIAAAFIEREPLIQLSIDGEVLELAKADAHRIAVALLALLGYDERSKVWIYPRKGV